MENTIPHTHHGDFLITEKKVDALKDSLIFSDNDFHCYTRMPHYLGNKGLAILIGRVYDITCPSLGPQEIVDSLEKNLSEACVEERLQPLSGKFLLLIKHGGQWKVYPDAGALLSIFYSKIEGSSVVGSSLRHIEKSMGIHFTPSAQITQFIHSATFHENGCFWMSDQSIIPHIYQLLPNHKLVFHSLKAERRKLYPWEGSSKDKPGQFAQLLRNSLKPLKDQPVLLPVTAGIDSRLILAAAIAEGLEFTPYLFDTRGGEKDVEIGEKLCRSVGLELQVYPEENPTSEFRLHFEDRFHYFTEEDRLSHFYYHWKEGHQNHFNVNGTGGEIFRAYYDFLDVSHPETVVRQLGYKNPKLFSSRFSQWLKIAEKRDPYFSIPDLIFWEYKIGLWYGRYQQEKNAYIQDYSPFCNYLLARLGQSVDYRKRRSYSFQFHKAVLDNLLPRLNDFPINPASSWLHKAKLIAYRYPLFWKTFNRIRSKYR